jgi:hypothetical protein
MKGKDLVFLSKISRTGIGTEPFPTKLINNSILENEEFELVQLCVKEETYVAHGIGTYCVKIRTEPAQRQVEPKPKELTPSQKIQEIINRTTLKLDL